MLDRLVVGIKDKQLCARLQLDADLTLQKALDSIRQIESVRQQQAELHQEVSSVMPHVDNRRFSLALTHADWFVHRIQLFNSCREKGHYVSVWMSRRLGCVETENETLESGFLERSRRRMLETGKQQYCFKLDALRVSRVHVDPLIPVVRVSPGAMFGPFMVDDGVPPDGVNMGALGSTVGTLVAAFMDPVRGPLDGVSRTRPKYEKATASKYDAALDCLVSRTSKNGPSIVDKKEASQVLIDRLGVRIAYGAFEEMLNASSTKAGSSALMDQLSELLGSVQRTFFAAYCFQFCQHEAPNMAGHAMSGRFRCNAVLRDVEAFWKAFTCPVGSSMRPANACVI
ncbi:hypothetical protein MTO96_046060 [Rhipicephalus appendiculatus]